MDVYGTGIINASDALYMSWYDAWASGSEKVVDPNLWMEIAEEVPMVTTAMHLPRFDLTHEIAPWQGARIEQGISYQERTVESNPYESTFALDRDKINDLETLGRLTRAYKGMGVAKGLFHNKLVWPYLYAATGGTNPGGGAASSFSHTALEKTWEYSTIVHDGQPLFSNTHPYRGGNNDNLLVSGGGTDWWFVADNSESKPVGVGKYRDFEFYEYTEEYRRSNNRRWGQDGRFCVFPGDYRSIVACNDTLNDANFRLALLQLAGMRKDDGSTAGKKATHLITSVSNQFAALDVLKLRLAGGADNVLTGIVKPVVCRFFG
jgi:phage major head subunit gpT-like protein